MKVLILWSGGIESTALLKWVLENTEAEVFTHYIHNLTPSASERCDAEISCMSWMTPRLQNIRFFTQTPLSTFSYWGQTEPADYIHHGLKGLEAMRLAGCDLFIRANCEEDQWSKSPDRKTYNRRVNYPGHWTIDRRAVIEPHLRPGEEKDKVYINLKIAEQPKTWHTSYLGDLLHLTHSCRAPRLGEQCNVCRSCKEREAAIQGTSAVPAIANRIASEGVPGKEVYTRRHWQEDTGQLK